MLKQRLCDSLHFFPNFKDDHLKSVFLVNLVSRCQQFRQMNLILPEVIVDLLNSPYQINIGSLISIKLNGENFLRWKYQIVITLKTMDLFEHRDPKVEPPYFSSSTFTDWYKADDFVISCINATLDSSLVHLAIGASSAVELLWKILEESYLQQAFA